MSPLETAYLHVKLRWLAGLETDVIVEETDDGWFASGIRVTGTHQGERVDVTGFCVEDAIRLAYEARDRIEDARDVKLLGMVG